MIYFFAVQKLVLQFETKINIGDCNCYCYNIMYKYLLKFNNIKISLQSVTELKLFLRLNNSLHFTLIQLSSTIKNYLCYLSTLIDSIVVVLF